MKRLTLFATAAAVLAAVAAPAAAPQFQTPAPIAYLVDLSSGAVLYSKNADQRIPPASMAKMMTAELAFELIKAGQLSLNKQCTVRPETWREWHSQGSTMFLSAGEQVSVENLLYGVVTVSGNDSSVVLAECIAGTAEAFVQQMNALAKDLGLDNSRFCNPVGWPDEGCSYVTARDLAQLARATIERHPQLYAQFYGRENFTWGKTLGSGQPITQPNRNPIMGRVAGADGLKTGYTQEAGYGFTGSAEQNGRRLVEVVAGLDSAAARSEQATRLMEWGFNAWQAKPLFKQGAEIASADVQMGSKTKVPLVAPRDLLVTIPAGLNLARQMQVKVRYDGPIRAPIAKGDQIAQLVVTTGETPPQTMPLVAGEDVGEAGFFTRAWIGLKSLLGLA
ncbi:MAG TPA: D-alanyl-D-alanine carboxypeptidase family protein [Sphingomicrobium sp.]|nr:D-alanyl-D-alanine carboxypeptidase family protein [Sphingomicrobium sp.]